MSYLQTTMLRRLIFTIFAPFSLALGFGALPALAADPSVRTRIEPQSGTESDTFLLAVTIDRAVSVGRPVLSGSADFTGELVDRSGTVPLTSGIFTPRITYTYRLKPTRSGELSTPSVSVEADGIQLSAKELPVHVAKAAPEPMEAMAGTELFIRQTATPAIAFQGQQISHRVHVYTRVPLFDLTLDDPTLDGFWQETVTDRQESQKTVNGHEYAVVQSRRALYPLRKGILQLPARTLRVKTRDTTRGGWQWDMLDPQQLMAGGPLRDVSLDSNSSTIEVRPLPEPPPELANLVGSSTLVGATTVKATYSVDTTKVGESKSLSIEVLTEGNAQPLKNIRLAEPAGVKVYEETPETTLDRRGPKLIMRKVFRYSIVPLRPGLTRLPAVKLVYFDPEANSYRVAASGDMAFPVEGKAVDIPTSAEQPSPAETTQETETPAAKTSQLIPQSKSGVPGPPIRYEEPDTLSKLSERVTIQLGLLALAAAIGLGIVVFVGTKWLRTSPAQTVTPAHVKGASDILQIERLLRKLLASKFGERASLASVDELRSLAAKEITEKETSLAVRSLLDDIEVLRYGPAGAVEPERIAALKVRLEEVLERL